MMRNYILYYYPMMMTMMMMMNDDDDDDDNTVDVAIAVYCLLALVDFNVRDFWNMRSLVHQVVAKRAKNGSFASHLPEATS